jgi:hypothetical protein
VQSFVKVSRLIQHRAMHHATLHPPLEGAAKEQLFAVALETLRYVETEELAPQASMELVMTVFRVGAEAGVDRVEQRGGALHPG